METNQYTILKIKIRELAYLKGMSVQDIAEKLGYARPKFYYQLKKEKLSHEEKLKICRLLNTQIENLFELKDFSEDNITFDKIINEITTVTCSQCNKEGLPGTCTQDEETFEWFHYPSCWQKYSKTFLSKC